MFTFAHPALELVMPACARSEIVRPGVVAVYHVWSRCVRRAFLCGHDPVTKQDFEHRRTWIRAFQEQLAALFAIEVGFRAELSNHLHLVIRTRPDVVATWTDRDVVRRWLTITKLTKSRDGRAKEVSSIRIAMEMAKPGRVDQLRKRLSHPSFFMAALCEHVALCSNREDGCKGRFWEDRFNCRELADEAAILVCGIYVDLNQVRAGEAITPETSTHTSAYDRIHARGQSVDRALDGWMCKFTIDERGPPLGRPGHPAVCSASGRRASDKGLLPISLDDYLRLLDESGRMVRSDKSGSIPSDLEPILMRLGVQVDKWSTAIKHYDKYFGHVVGHADVLARRAMEAGRRWYRGKSRCAECFG